MADNTNLPTVAELAEIAQEELRLALDPLGTGAVDLHDGSRATALVSLQVGLASRAVRYAADREAAARASTAAGDDLDIVARDFYGEARKPEAFATGVIRLLRGVGLPATTIPQGSRFAVPATGSTPAVVYGATATTAVLLGETTADVALTAVEPGEAGNIENPATVTQIVDVLPDTTWAVTAPPPGVMFGGGALAESDDVLRARLLQIGTEDSDQRGTQRAILTGCLRVPGVRWVTVVEPLNGTVVAYVGDAGFGLPDALREAVRVELLNWRCLGVPVNLRPFTVSNVNVDAVIYMARALDNYDQGAIRAAAAREVLVYFNGRPNPDEYFREMISAAVARSHPEVQHVVLNAPGLDVLRPPAAGYSALSTIFRYRVRASDMRFTLSAPLTT